MNQDLTFFKSKVPLLRPLLVRSARKTAIPIKLSKITARVKRPCHYLEYFNFEDKQKRTATEGVKAWINREEYRRFVASKKRDFEDQVDLEMGVTKPAQK